MREPVPKSSWSGEVGRVAGGTRRSLLMQVVGLLLGYVVHILLARWMGTVGYGVYVYALSWVGLLTPLAVLGLPLLVVRFVPTYQVEGQWQQLRGLLVWGWRGILIRGLLLMLVAMALVALFGDRLNSGYRLALFIGLWLVPLRGLLRFASGLHQALHRIGWSRSLAAMQHGMLLVIAFWLWQGQEHLTSVQAMASTLAAVALVLLFQIPLLLKAMPAQVRSVQARYDRTYWVRVALPMFLVGGSFAALNQTDTLMVGTLLGPAEAGLYTAASKIAGLVGVVLIAAGGASAPVVAALHAEGAYARLQRLLSKVALWIFWPSLAVAVGLSLAAEPLLWLFGEEFVAARWTLVLLAVGQLIHAGGGAVAGVLMWTGHQNGAAAVLGGGVLINVLFNGIGITFFGIEGAALATAMSIALTNVLLCRVAQHRAGVNPSIAYALLHRSEWHESL